MEWCFGEMFCILFHQKIQLYLHILYHIWFENYWIKYSEIPIYEEPKKYNDILIENYYIKKGKIIANGDKLISGSNEIFVINKNINAKITNKIYTYITPYCDSSLGLIFGIQNFSQVDEYYFFQLMKLEIWLY